VQIAGVSAAWSEALFRALVNAWNRRKTMLRRGIKTAYMDPPAAGSPCRKNTRFAASIPIVRWLGRSSLILLEGHPR
jgi:hypothetical protein